LSYFISGTPLSSPTFHQLVNEIGKRLVHSVDLSASVSYAITMNQGHWRVMPSRAHRKGQMTTAADLAFYILATEVTANQSQCVDLSFYRYLISQVGGFFSPWKFSDMVDCDVGRLRYKSVCLDLLLQSDAPDIGMLIT